MVSAIIPLIPSSPIAAAPAPFPKPREIFFFEKKGRHEEECVWKIESSFPNEFLVTKQSKAEVSTSRYSSDGQIQEYHFRHLDCSGDVHVQMNDRTLRVIGEKGNQTHEKVYVLKGHFPWIQQATLGMKDFILSPNHKLEFYIVNPKDLSLHKLIAEKRRIENVPGLGHLLRVDVRSDSFFYNLLGIGGKIWFDTKTAELKKMVTHADPREHPLITEWRRNDP